MLSCSSRWSPQPHRQSGGLDGDRKACQGTFRAGELRAAAPARRPSAPDGQPDRTRNRTLNLTLERGTPRGRGLPVRHRIPDNAEHVGHVEKHHIENREGSLPEDGICHVARVGIFPTCELFRDLLWRHMKSREIVVHACHGYCEFPCDTDLRRVCPKGLCWCERSADRRGETWPLDASGGGSWV
jgi:hypothetical protein